MALPDDAWLLGVDAGGTRTRAWLVRTDAPDAVREGEAGGSNWSARSLADCSAAVEDAVRSATGDEEPPLAAVCVCAAGYHPERHAEPTLAWLRERWPGTRTRLEPDLVAAWAGAFGGEPGVAVVAGTGSVAYGRGPGGAEARAGGWGPLVDDGGSGYWIGRRALETVARAADGRGSGGPLVAVLVGHESRTAWLRRVIAERWDSARVAVLAETVVRVAAGGDPGARALLEEAAVVLSELVVAVERRLGAIEGADLARVALVGGLAEGVRASGCPGLLREPFSAALAERGSRLRVQDPLGSPVFGALLLAAEIVGGDAGRAELRDRLIPRKPFSPV